MYTEENIKKRKFSLRDILLKVMVIMVFIILVIFLVAKVMQPNNKKDNNNYDKVFIENLNQMEEVAIDYFTKDNLPKDVGTSKTLTLRQMINQNIIESFTDANKKACDVNNSYIRITNNDEYYTLKVSLLCPNKEDSRTKTVGQYEYCKKDICERRNETDKQKIEAQKEEVKENIVENNNNNNNTNNQNNSNNNSNTNTTPVTPSKTYIYEYKKETPATVSEWSSWSGWELNSNRLEQVICKNEDLTCLKEVQLYSRREKIGTSNGKPVYATVNYYSYRTRTLTEAKTDIKWSDYNDRNLLTNGYNYTGNKKEK